MEAPITAPTDGTVERVAVSATAQVEGGDLLVVLEPDATIIGGVAGGRRIAVPPRGTRPTTDRVRESLFNIVTARRDLTRRGGAGPLRRLGCAGPGGAVARGGVGAVRRVRPPQRRPCSSATSRRSACPARRCAAGRWPPCWRPEPQRRSTSCWPTRPTTSTTAEVEAVLAALTTHGWAHEGTLVVVERAAAGAPLSWPSRLAAVAAAGLRRHPFGAGRMA